MSAYDNDDRVDLVNEDRCQVFVNVVSEEFFDVYAPRQGEWYFRPSFNSQPYRRAVDSLFTEAGFDIWLAHATCGPFRSADEAIRALIGEPR